MPVMVPPPLRIAWRTPLPSDAMPQVALASDRYYVATETHLVALDPATGATAWTVPIRCHLHAWTDDAIVVGDNTVGGRTPLQGFAAADGRPLWSAPVPFALRLVLDTNDTLEPQLALGAARYLHAQLAPVRYQRLVRIDVLTGAWEVAVDLPNDAQPCTASPEAIWCPRSGAPEVWRWDGNAASSMDVGDPAVSVGAAGDLLYTFHKPGEYRLWERATGRPVERFPGFYGRIQVDSDAAFVVLKDGVARYDRGGALAWKATLGLPLGTIYRLGPLVLATHGTDGFFVDANSGVVLGPFAQYGLVRAHRGGWLMTAGDEIIRLEVP